MTFFDISFIELRSVEDILESTLERGRHRPDLHAGSTGELPEDHLHVIEGFTDDEEHDYVGDQEGAAAVLVSRIREPPDVPEADRERHAGHEELQPASPLRPLLLLFLLDWHRDLRSKLRGVSKGSSRKGEDLQLALRIIASRGTYSAFQIISGGWRDGQLEYTGSSASVVDIILRNQLFVIWWLFFYSRMGNGPPHGRSV